MIKTIAGQIKEFKLPSILTPICMIGEVICEMIIPILMGQIVDNGIQAGNMGFILATGGKPNLPRFLGERDNIIPAREILLGRRQAEGRILADPCTGCPPAVPILIQGSHWPGQEPA